jgi:hypothetical protein
MSKNAAEETATCQIKKVMRGSCKALECVLADRPVRPFGYEAEQSMAKSKRPAMTVLLTDEHLRKMIEDHLLKEDEIGDRIKVARVAQKLLDGALGLPEKPWHDWDDWVKGLE